MINQRLYEWRRHWEDFLGIYPEALEIPLKLDRDWFAQLLAQRSLEIEEERLTEVIAALAQLVKDPTEETIRKAKRILLDWRTK